MKFSEIQVGDRILISKPSSNSPYAPIIRCVARVTAVRPKSFDAGGLCFRKDGVQWSGYSRAHPISGTEREGSVKSLDGDGATGSPESAGA